MTGSRYSWSTTRVPGTPQTPGTTPRGQASWQPRCSAHLQGRKEMFYLTTHSTRFIYSYMASDILWLRTILIVRKETSCRHIGYSFRLTARVLLYAPSHRQDITYHGLCYTVVDHWLEREITQWIHPMKDRSDDRSHHEQTLLPRSYISLQLTYKHIILSALISRHHSPMVKSVSEEWL